MHGRRATASGVAHCKSNSCDSLRTCDDRCSFNQNTDIQGNRAICKLADSLSLYATVERSISFNPPSLRSSARHGTPYTPHSGLCC